jgi:ferritin
MLSETTKTTLNLAVEAELTASMMYKHIANHCQKMSLFGAYKLFKHESEEELEHYEKLANYFNTRNEVAEMPEIPAQEAEIYSLKDALEVALEAEVELGAKYNKWTKAMLDNDIPTGQFLLWYVKKQTESIGFYQDWLKRLSMVENNTAGILIIDKELGEL